MASFDEYLKCDGEFKPYIEDERYSTTVYWKGDPDYSVVAIPLRPGDLTVGLTLYRSLDTNEVVGCRIDR